LVNSFFEHETKKSIKKIVNFLFKSNVILAH
jgi:hypothetical protein